MTGSQAAGSPGHSRVTDGPVSDGHTSVSSNIGVQMVLDCFFPIKLCCFFTSVGGAGHHERGRGPHLLGEGVAMSRPPPPSLSPSPPSAGVMAKLPTGTHSAPSIHSHQVRWHRSRNGMLTPPLKSPVFCFFGLHSSASRETKAPGLGFLGADSRLSRLLSDSLGN